MTYILDKLALNKALMERLELLLQKHSEDYIFEVLDSISQQKKDSTSFLHYLEQYKQDKIMDDDPFEVIDQIISEKGLLSVDLADVKPLSHIHQIYSLNYEDLNTLPENKQDYDKIIVYIWGNESISLLFLSEVFNIVRDKLIIKDTKMIFGTSMDETLAEPRIDFITYI